MALYGVTAESQENADRAVKEWGLDYQLFSDPTHTLRNYLAEQGMITIRISGGENSTDSGFYKVHPKIKLYKHGVAQPGLLCVKPDRSVVFSWAIEPSLMNLGGASDRPVPRDIWTAVQAKLADPESSESVALQNLGRRGICSACTLL